jgi:hypothetical protein
MTAVSHNRSTVLCITIGDVRRWSFIGSTAVVVQKDIQFEMRYLRAKGKHGFIG